MSSGSIEAIANLPIRYHWVQRLVHWLMAIVIIAALAIGLYCSYLVPGSAERQFLLDIHKSLGMTALVLIVLRIPLRAMLGEPRRTIAPPRHERLASHMVHGTLYLLMAAMPVSGYITSASEGRSLPWFGLFNWPNLLPENRHTGRLLATVHHYGAYVFFAALSLHLAAVVWHHIVKRDEVLSRMI